MCNVIRYAVLVAAAAAVWSCEKSPSVPNEPDEPQNYSFDRIEYTLGDGERMEESVTPTPPVTISNNTSSEQTYVREPLENAYDRVTFSRDHGQEFEFADEEQTVKIPTYILPDGAFQYDVGKKWLYREGDQELKPEYDVTDTYPIPPNHALTITTSIRRRSIAAHYKLYLTGDRYGDQRVIEGSWSGSFVVGCDLDCEMNEIPNGD